MTARPAPGMRDMGLLAGVRQSVPPLTRNAVLDFWFKETSPQAWWKSDPAFDLESSRRFGALHAAASAGELYEWRSEPRGRLAEIIVLDQFSRNIHRGSPSAFACDPMALALAQEAVAGSHEVRLSGQERVFLYLPVLGRESTPEELAFLQQPGSSF